MATASGKFKVTVEYGRDNSYRVKECVNTLHPLPGDVLDKRGIEELVSRAKVRGGQVVIKEGK